MSLRRSSASSAASRHSPSTAGDAKVASLRDLSELRDRYTEAQAKSATAKARREVAEKDVRRLENELVVLGFDPSGQQPFDDWYAIRLDGITKTVSGIEKLLGVDDGT